MSKKKKSEYKIVSVMDRVLEIRNQPKYETLKSKCKLCGTEELSDGKLVWCPKCEMMGINTIRNR